MKKVWITTFVIVVLGALYFVMQPKLESEVPTSGMPIPGSSVSDTEVNSVMPVPGSNTSEIIVN